MIDVDEAFATLDRAESGPSATTLSEQRLEAGRSGAGRCAQLTMTLINRFAPTGYGYANGWRYLDAEGRLLGCTVRYDRHAPGEADDKQFRPFTFCQDPRGRQEWRCKAWPEPRPLYGLDRLAARPDAPVLVVEGEKTADAAAQRFPGSCDGHLARRLKCGRQADWSCLAGRAVTIWPDADEPGARIRRRCHRHAEARRARKIRARGDPGRPSRWLGPGRRAARRRRRGGLADARGGAARPARDAPLPLFPPLPAVGALSDRGTRSGASPPAAAAIASKIQVPEVIAAQSVLAAASLAAQAHADVMLPYGQTRPLSLFLVTVAGVRRPQVQRRQRGARPVRKREKALKTDYERELAELVDRAGRLERREEEDRGGQEDRMPESRKDALLALGPRARLARCFRF